jgi:hypothetical protein
MVTAALDPSTLLKGLPEGAWVAISVGSQKVVAYAADLQTAIDMAHERGENNPLVMRVPEHSSIPFP